MRLGRFYVYRHHRADDGTPFYVGKGIVRKTLWCERTLDRRRRSPFWHAVVASAGGFTAEIVTFFDDEAACFEKERELIALYGRRDFGRGPLVNLTDGGDGRFGWVPSTEERALMRERMLGERNPNWGKRLSAETCRKKSIAVSGSRHHLHGTTLPDAWRQAISRGKLGARNPFYGKPTPRSRPVVDTTTSVVYPSVAHAARALGIAYTTAYNGLAGLQANHTMLVWHSA